MNNSDLIPFISKDLVDKYNSNEKTIETFIGVDGGGTSTVAICVDQNLRKIKHCKMELSCNPNSVGLETAVERIVQIIKSVKTYHVSAIGLGLAGVSSFDEEQLKRSIWEVFTSDNESNQDVVLPKIYIESDAFAGLASASVAEGMVLIAGTGVNCSGYILKENGERDLVRSAAWGPLLGDSGSGYWIAQQSLIRLCQWIDGMIGNELDSSFVALRELIFNQLNIKSMDQLVKWVYEDMAWNRIASLTKLIVDNSTSNAVCASITYDAGSKLAQYVKAVAKKFGDRQGLKLVLVGSVITQTESPVRDSLKSHLEGTNIEIVIPENSAELGSAWFAKYFSNQ